MEPRVDTGQSAGAGWGGNPRLGTGPHRATSPPPTWPDAQAAPHPPDAHPCPRGPSLTLLYGAGRFLPPPPAAPRAMAGRFLMGPPPRFTRAAACAPPRPLWEPALPRPRPPPRPPRWLRFSLMMSSRDMSILSAMAGAESGLGSSPRVSTPARHFRRRARSSGAAALERKLIGRGARAGRTGACVPGPGLGGRCFGGAGRGAVVFVPSRADVDAANGRAGRRVIRWRRCEGREVGGACTPLPLRLAKGSA
jgi:hypothetical protein